MILKLQETQLGKTEPLFERSEFDAVLTVGCVFCSFSRIKVLEQQIPNHSPQVRWVSIIWSHAFVVVLYYFSCSLSYL
ncbi:hypothetical protein SAMN02745136_02951 [Anaerocolumna jejuensis DSM 15929]|uniref:Uncharacterized protein n=1 Tax=Anaerocolumna jejuensis DSM 15929 TaxID=1121322 RepID=A0A1M6U1A8_9FIRM|nr:hypothetical protein SAMN02745136_02951 [Anaerocolumna jejuensis DSM 15929]